MKVKIETLKKNTRRMPQCYNCQAYNHTRKYCNREPRCVRCAGKHPSRDCDQSKNEPPKCIHCGNHHPANYRGCEVVKELQRMRNYKRKPTSNSSQPRLQSGPKQIPLNSAKVREGTTYAQAAKQNENIKTAPSQENHVLLEILQKLSAINLHLATQDQRLESMGELLKKQEERLGTLEQASMIQDKKIVETSKTKEVIDYLYSSPYKFNKKK